MQAAQGHMGDEVPEIATSHEAQFLHRSFYPSAPVVHPEGERSLYRGSAGVQGNGVGVLHSPRCIQDPILP